MTETTAGKWVVVSAILTVVVLMITGLAIVAYTNPDRGLSIKISSVTYPTVYPYKSGDAVISFNFTDERRSGFTFNTEYLEVTYSDGKRVHVESPYASYSVLGRHVQSLVETSFNIAVTAKVAGMIYDDGIVHLEAKV